jgi:ferredoxin
MTYKVSFINSNKDPVVLEAGDNLSVKLNIQNSPILFGCRIGICGTCLVRVHEQDAHLLHERTENEKEFLEGLFPGDETLRLACQIDINSNIKLEKIKP